MSKHGEQQSYFEATLKRCRDILGSIGPQQEASVNAESVRAVHAEVETMLDHLKRCPLEVILPVRMVESIRAQQPAAARDDFAVHTSTSGPIVRSIDLGQRLVIATQRLNALRPHEGIHSGSHNAQIIRATRGDIAEVLTVFREVPLGPVQAPTPPTAEQDHPVNQAESRMIGAAAMTTSDASRPPDPVSYELGERVKFERAGGYTSSGRIASLRYPLDRHGASIVDGYYTLELDSPFWSEGQHHWVSMLVAHESLLSREVVTV